MTEQQKLKLIQYVLYDNTSYAGNTNGEVDDDDREQVATVIQERADLGVDSVDLIILALLACGYNDKLTDDGVAGEEFAIALHKAFGIE